MSSAGHIMDMINRMKYNASLKTSYRTRYARVKEAYEKELGMRHVHHLMESQITKQELENLRQQIRNTIRRENRESLLKTIVVFVIVSVFLGYMAYRFIIKNGTLIE